MFLESKLISIRLPFRRDNRFYTQRSTDTRKSYIDSRTVSTTQGGNSYEFFLFALFSLLLLLFRHEKHTSDHTWKDEDRCKSDKCAINCSLFCSYALRRDRDRNYLTVNYLHQRRCGNSNDQPDWFVSFNARSCETRDAD